MSPSSRRKYQAGKYRQARPIIEALLELYPSTFNWWRPRPLKIGIGRDLVDTGLLAEAEVKAALRLYCNTAQYVLACRAGAARVDLDGAVVGSVTAEEQRNWMRGGMHGNGTSTRAARLEAQPQRQTTTQRKKLRRLQKAQAQAKQARASGA